MSQNEAQSEATHFVLARCSVLSDDNVGSVSAARQVPILQALACGAAARQVVDLEDAGRACNLYHSCVEPRRSLNQEASKEESHAKSLSADAEDPSREKEGEFDLMGTERHRYSLES